MEVEENTRGHYRRHLDTGFLLKLVGWGAAGTFLLRMIVSPFVPFVDLWVASFFCDAEVRTATEVFHPRPGETVWSHTIKCMYSGIAGVDITFFVFPTATLITSIPVVFALALLYWKRVLPLGPA